MGLDQQFGGLLGQAVSMRRIVLLFAVVAAFAVLATVGPAGTSTGPSTAEAHDGCSSGDGVAACLRYKFYENLGPCREQGRRSLAATPLPNRDWEHYHCVPVGDKYLLKLYDLGADG